MERSYGSAVNLLLYLSICFCFVALFLSAFPQLIFRTPPSLEQRVTLVEIAILMASALAALLFKSNRTFNSSIVTRHVGIIRIVQYFSLGGSLFSTAFAIGYNRPIIFFVFIFSFFASLLIELFASTPKILPFTLKLVAGSGLLSLSLAALYPGFFGADTYTVYYIANSLIISHGGLPQPFLGVIWYDFTPMLSLQSALMSIFGGIPLRQSVIATGFITDVLAILAAGALAQRLFKDTRISLLAMWLGSVIPLIWQWPEPEMFAVSLMLLIVAVVSGQKGYASYFACLPLVVVVVATGVVPPQGERFFALKVHTFSAISQ